MYFFFNLFNLNTGKGKQNLYFYPHFVDTGLGGWPRCNIILKCQNVDKGTGGGGVQTLWTMIFLYFLGLFKGMLSLPNSCLLVFCLYLP